MLNVNVDLSTLTTIEGITQYVLSNAIVSGVILAGVSGAAYKVGKLAYLQVKRLVSIHLFPVYTSTERYLVNDTLVLNFTKDNAKKVTSHSVVSLDGGLAINTTYLLKGHGKNFLVRVTARELASGNGTTITSTYKTHIIGLGMKSTTMTSILAGMSEYRPEPGVTQFSFNAMCTSVSSITMDQLAISKENMDTIRRLIDHYWCKNTVSKYTHLGIPNKRVIVLSGPPGTGKSSIARAIVAEANRTHQVVYCARSVSNMVDLINEGRSTIIMDDIDAACDANIIAPRASKDVNATDVMADYKISLGNVLSALDFVDRIGAKVGDGCLLIITTNHPERIDPAVFRPGRVDLHLHIDYPDRDALIRYYSCVSNNDDPSRMVDHMVTHNVRVPTMNRHVATADTFDGALLSYLKDADATAYQLEDVVTETASMDTSQGVDVVPCY